MDAGPFRGSRPSERRPTTSTQRQAEAPKQAAPAVEPPKSTTVHRATKVASTNDKDRFLKRFRWPIVIVILALLVFGWFAYSKMGGAAGTVDSGKYQAVFLDGGQVYFGRLQMLDKQNMKLTDVFYLKAAAGEEGTNNPQDSSSETNNVQLIKLGKEIHGPEDTMVINRDKVLFFENLKKDSQVSKLMKDFKS